MIYKDKFGNDITKKPGVYYFLCKLNNMGYVGKTIDELLTRINNHCRPSGKQYIDKQIKELKIENFEIEILAEYEYGSVTDIELFALETAFIEYFDCMHPKGYNLVLIGEGSYGYKYTKEQKENISNALKGKFLGEKNPMFGTKRIGLNLGRKNNIEVKEKMKNVWKERKKNNYISPLKGKSKSKETKQKMSENHADFKGDKNPMFNKTHTLETIIIIKKANKNRDMSYLKKPVKQIDKNTDKIIKIYNSVNEAAISLGNSKKYSGISQVCNKHRKLAYGYKWEYV